MKKVAIIGHFALGHECINGQTIKTKIVTEELERRFGKKQVKIVDTHGGIKSLIKAPFYTFIALKDCFNIIILPANNGLRIITPLLSVIKLFFKNRKLHYVVIGGWLPEFLKTNKWLSWFLKRFDGIYVETSTMKKALEMQGFKNLFIMPNCKKLDGLNETEMIYHSAEPYKLCTFSRVMKEKGIEDAIQIVKKINEQQGRIAFTLDIYGQVDTSQTEWFEKLILELPDYIAYKGIIPFEDSVIVLKEYYALLFPTRFYTEGIPGTIIDAYAAGIPVIASKWQSFDDVIEDHVTGIGYEFGNNDQLLNILYSILADPTDLANMKVNCLKKSGSFKPEYALDVICNELI